MKKYSGKFCSPRKMFFSYGYRNAIYPKTAKLISIRYIDLCQHLIHMGGGGSKQSKPNFAH